jgi:putative membrane protein
MDTGQQLGGPERPDPDAPDGQGRADYRFLLANERTFLAYIRTALALHVAGLGVLQFLTHTADWARYLLGVALVVGGSYVAVSGHARTRRNESAMRAGHDLRPGSLSVVLVATVATVPLVAAIAMTL